MIILRKNKFKNAETESCDSENKSYIEVEGIKLIRAIEGGYDIRWD